MGWLVFGGSGGVGGTSGFGTGGTSGAGPGGGTSGVGTDVVVTSGETAGA